MLSESKKTEIRKELKKIVKKVNQKKVLEHALYLKYRWNDEKEFEDWKEYDKAIRNNFDFFDIIKTIKKPFGFILKLNSYPVKAQISISINTVKASLKI